MRFLLDTNFFLVPGQFKVDVFKELGNFGKPEIFTLDSVILELEKLGGSRKKDAGSAKVALEFVKDKNICILQSENKRVDDEIERISGEEGFIVCTQDRELMKRLKEKGIKVITLRQKKYLVGV